LESFLYWKKTTSPQMNILAAVYDWLSPLQDMDEEGFQAFVDGISRRSHENFVDAFASHLETAFSKEELKALLNDTRLENSQLTVIGPSISKAITLF
jgi:predicted transcriptional regulator